MVPYYLLVFVPVLAGLLRGKGRMKIGAASIEDRNNLEITTFFVMLLVILMFRGSGCGADTERYKQVFYIIRHQNWFQALFLGEREIGYSLLNKLIALFTDESQILIAITSMLSVLPMLYFYRREAEQPLLTMVLFMTVAPFTMYFSGIRQAVAMGFLVPAWYLAKNKKPIKFVLLSLLAMQFHQSAFIMLAIYPLYHAKITPRWLLVVVPLMAMVYLFNDTIFNFLSIYLWDDYGVAESTGSTTILLLLVMFAAYSFLMVDETKMDKDLFALRNMLLFSVVLQCFAPVHTLAMRMNYYYLVFVPLLIPKIANRSKRQLKIIATYAVIVMTVFFMFYYLIKAHIGSDILRLYPYIPFWN